MWPAASQMPLVIPRKKCQQDIGIALVERRSIWLDCVVAWRNHPSKLSGNFQRVFMSVDDRFCSGFSAGVPSPCSEM